MSSYWIDSVKEITKEKQTIQQDVHTEVCIIGGGITGITCAYLLAQQGYETVILEKGEIAKQTTGNTTAKITSQHGLFYKYLIESQGERKAQQYLQANEQAIDDIEKIIKKEKIPCDFEKQSSYVYTQEQSQVASIQAEVKALKKLGFEAEYLEKTPLPLPILSAIRFPNQAQFHPRKYIKGLVGALNPQLVSIFEDSKVLDIKKQQEEYCVYTNSHKVTAKYVILACHYPIINSCGYYFLKMYQQMSYIIGVETDKSELERNVHQ